MPNLAYLIPARDDKLQRARASEYRRSLPHSPAFTEKIGRDLLDAGVLQSLIAIAEADSCAAGSLLAELSDAYANQLSKQMAQTDNGELVKLPGQQSLDFYIQHVEAAIGKLRGH